MAPRRAPAQSHCRQCCCYYLIVQNERCPCISSLRHGSDHILLPVQAVLRFVAHNARSAATTGACSQLQVAFFAVLTAEVLQASPRRLNEDTVVRLQPQHGHWAPQCCPMQHPLRISELTC